MLSDKDKRITSEDVQNYMHSRGLEKGARICSLAKNKHPNAVFITPVYRGCIVIPNKEIDGKVEIIAYHDPEWLGQDMTEENMDDFKEEVVLVGQRDRLDVFKNGVQLSY